MKAYFPMIVLYELLYKVHATVSAAVVYQDAFIGLIALGYYRQEASLNILCHIIYWYDDTYFHRWSLLMALYKNGFLATKYFMPLVRKNNERK